MVLSWAYKDSKLGAHTRIFFGFGLLVEVLGHHYMYFWGPGISKWRYEDPRVRGVWSADFGELLCINSFRGYLGSNPHA